jgi:hypothetical protein
MEKYQSDKKHWLFQKENKKLKRFELSPQVVLEKICAIFNFVREKKNLNLFKYMASKPYQKKS